MVDFAPKRDYNILVSPDMGRGARIKQESGSENRTEAASEPGTSAGGNGEHERQPHPIILTERRRI